MKNLLVLSLLAIAMITASKASEMTFSGEASGEARYFMNKGLYGNDFQSQASFSLEPQIRYSWDNDRQVSTFTPYIRIDDTDDERTHADIRELSYVGAFNDLEIRLGISKIFWGVTESSHLVDVINQVDTVDNIDGEDKLGQPMLNLNYFTNIGTFSVFALPYFRERTFSGKEGRYRGPLVIDTDDVSYTHKDSEKHVDYALRWSHYVGDLEWGLSYFRGTNRDPFFTPTTHGDLAVTYTQMEQYSLDTQYIVGDWLLKSEMIVRDSDLEKKYFSTVSGFEYTFSNINSTGLDIGLLAEWLYDERQEKTQGAFYDHTFVGTRVALNDVKSTELLAGAFVDNKDVSLTSFRLEAQRRINDNWKWEAEVNIIHEPSASNNLVFFKNDDYVQVKLSYFW